MSDEPDGRPVHEPHRHRIPSPLTTAVHAGRPPDRPDGPLNQPVMFASTYHAGGPVAYGRDGNETWTALEEAIGALERGDALAFASGMAAIAAVVEEVPVGAPVVVPVSGYTGTRAVLREAPAGRWDVRLADVSDTDATLAACAGAALLVVESPTNPLMDVADLPALIAGAHERGAMVAVDNTFATPLCQRPLAFGADVVIHSATKFLSGHSDVVLGATVTREPELCDRLRRRRSLRGAIAGPMEAWLALRGLRTLGVRMAHASASAAELARRLDGHPTVERVRYPGLPTGPWHERAAAQMTGFGAMVSFDVVGGAAAAEAAARATRLIVHATSLGGVETTMERRNRWPGEEDTPPGLLRLSAGCEDVEDVWEDLERALRIGAGASG